MTPEGMRRHAKFKRLDRLFESVIGATIQFVFWWWVVAGPVAFFSWLSTRIIEKASLGLQVAVFIAWGLVLVVALFLMSFPRLRNWLFTRLRDLGSFVPAIYSVTILMVSINFFGSVTYILATQGRLHFISQPGQVLSAGSVLDFFLWHFLKSIPLLEINSTLHRKEPLGYESAGVGWILLLFKLCVIVPVLSSFSGYWLFKREGSEQSKEADAT